MNLMILVGQVRAWVKSHPTGLYIDILNAFKDTERLQDVQYAISILEVTEEVTLSYTYKEVSY